MKKLYLMLIIILVFLIFLAWFMFNQGQDSFRLRDIYLEIEAPEQVLSGQEVSYLIKYKNNTKVTLEQTELFFSDNYQEILGDLEPGIEGEIQVLQSIFGQEGELKIIKARLKYQPENFRSFFENQAEVQIAIKSSSIIASLKGPEKASNGEFVEYELNYANKSDKAFENLEVVFETPENFMDKHIWQINKLNPDEVGSLKISGILIGEQGEEKIITAKIGKITQVKIITEIAGSPLLIEHVRQDNKYIINYQNKSRLSLENAEIIISFQGDAFDFDQFSKKIIFDSIDMTELALLEPGAKGQLEIDAPLKNPLPEENNFVLKTDVEIKSGDIKTSHELEIKLDSEFILQTKAYYESGQLPPKTGLITYYNIHWQLLNGANNLEETITTASLPLGIEWQGEVSNENGRIYYDQEANEVVWDLGEVPAWVGMSQPVYEAIFRIALRPQSSQVNKIVSILNQSMLITKDTFTEKTLSASSDYITSDLPDDPNISYEQGVIHD